MDDNTEVKVPVTSSYVSRCQDLSFSVSPMAFDPNCEKDQTDELSYPGADLVEYHRLIKLLHDFPTDMFVDRLLIDYRQSETDLEQTRTMLFELLRESENFSFDVNSEMKRRVNTRQGDSAP